MYDNEKSNNRVMYTLSDIVIDLSFFKILNSEVIYSQSPKLFKILSLTEETPLIFIFILVTNSSLEMVMGRI